MAPRVAQGARDRDEVVRCLRDGGDPNMICPDGWVKDECRPKDGDVGRSLLHHAAWAGDVGIFKLLVESGADVERKRNAEPARKRPRRVLQQWDGRLTPDERCMNRCMYQGIYACCYTGTSI